LNELAKRVLFAIPAAALFVFMIWMGGWYLAGMLIAVMFFLQQEVIRLLNESGSPTNRFFPYSIGLWVLLTPVLPYAFEIGVAIFLILIGVQTFEQTEQSIREQSGTIFAGVYAPLGLLSLLLVRNLGTNENGLLLTLILVFMVWGNDVFAYFGGKAFGKHAFAPSISPNKTWEGFFSGFVGAGVGLALMLWLVPLETTVSLPMFLPLVVLISIFGPIGDLAESKLKRRAGIKDSSSLLPGHGGFFDRFDALILAAPAAYVYFRLLESLSYVSF